MDASKQNVKEKGQSLVELALSMIFLAILLGVVVDGGIAFFNWITLRDAAQEGAIYASTHPALTDLAATTTRAKGASSDPILAAASVNVYPTKNAAGSDTPRCRGTSTAVDPNTGLTVTTANGITVEVTYYYTFVTPFFRPAGWAGVTIRAKATNTILNPPCP